MPMKFFNNVNVKAFFATILPAILIVALSIYVISNRPDPVEIPTRVLMGKPLAAHEDLYPVRTNPKGTPYLDKQIFEKAVEQFTKDPDPRAIADLIYLGNSNNIELALPAGARERYLKLASTPAYAAVASADTNREHLLQTYRDIVNGIGLTFVGTPVEIVLHDTRNPLMSIVALQNPISGRRIGDPNTNFGVQLIKNYSVAETGVHKSYISYGITLKDGREIKSTTIPLFHNTYGLIGFICLNIDISRLSKNDDEAVKRFISAFTQVTPNDQIQEMIQASKKP